MSLKLLRFSWMWLSWRIWLPFWEWRLLSPMLILSPGDKNSSTHPPDRLPRAPIVLEVTLVWSALGTMETLKTPWLLWLHGLDGFRSMVIIKHPQTQSSRQQRLSHSCVLHWLVKFRYHIAPSQGPRKTKYILSGAAPINHTGKGKKTMTKMSAQNRHTSVYSRPAKVNQMRDKCKSSWDWRTEDLPDGSSSLMHHRRNKLAPHSGWHSAAMRAEAVIRS